MIQVANQELYVFGKLISRHPEMPWLFSITDVYKACEKPIKGEAVKYGKDPEVTFTSKRPANWLAKNSKAETIDAVASKLRKRLKKYGVDCGLRKSNAAKIALETLTNKQLCVFSTKGGSAKAKVHGTYVAQDFIVDYAGFLNAKLKASINDVFISVLNGHKEEIIKKVEKNERIAKGTQTRRENKQLNDELVEACGFKKLLPMKVQEGINEGVLGLPAMKYKKLHGIKEPFNDNLTEEQVCMKNIGIALSTLRIRKHEKAELTHKEGKHIGLTSGQYARRITLEAVQA
jgi:hypothetical protein